MTCPSAEPHLAERTRQRRAGSEADGARRASGHRRAAPATDVDPTAVPRAPR
ncbi:hypothetical protein ABZ814_03900 [Micromonospora musae]|uniref:hypothetical protein n=1 Tax=Micromonospora musae TaxID=1894970 RepID=UPI0033DCCD18